MDSNDSHSVDDRLGTLDPLLAELATKRLSLMSIHVRILQLSWRYTKEMAREVQIRLENQKRIASDQIKALKSVCDRVIKDVKALSPDGKALIFRELCAALENRLNREGAYVETSLKRHPPETEVTAWTDQSFEFARISPSASTPFEIDDFLNINSIEASPRVKALLRQKIPSIFAESREISFSWKVHPSDVAVRAMIRLVSQSKVEEYSQDIRKMHLLKTSFERERSRQNLGSLGLNSAFQLTDSVNLLQFPYRNIVLILFLSLVLGLQLLSLRGVVPTARKLYTFLQFSDRGRFVILVISLEPSPALSDFRRHLRRVHPAKVSFPAKGSRPSSLPFGQQLLFGEHRPLQNHATLQQQKTV